jgi:hypothetical protein
MVASIAVPEAVSSSTTIPALSVDAGGSLAAGADKQEEDSTASMTSEGSSSIMEGEISGLTASSATAIPSPPTAESMGRVDKASSSSPDATATDTGAASSEDNETPQAITPEPKKTGKENKTEQGPVAAMPVTPASTGSSLPASAPSKLEQSSYEYNNKNNNNHQDVEASFSKGGNTNAQNLRPNRGRIVSLDRGRTEVSKQLRAEKEGGAAYPATDDERRKRSNTHHSASRSGASSSRRYSKYDSPDSSDDESSYFASNLPSPKSSRGSFYSSAGSVNARASFYSAGAKQESDASLSFSDESDDERNPMVQEEPQTVRISPTMPHHQNVVADLQLFPQRITRMHSVSSLVSSASSKSHQRSAGGSLTSAASDAEASLTDPSVQAELVNMMLVQQHNHQQQQQARAGSPVMGHPGMYYGTPSPLYPPPSASSTPPVLIDGSSSNSHPDKGMVHPQPMTQEQVQANEWFQGSHSSTVSGGEYGATGNNVQPLPPLGLRTASSTTHSSGTNTLPFVYSEDDDSELHFQRMAMAGSGGKQAAGGSSGPVQRKGSNGGLSSQGNSRQAPLSNPSGSVGVIGGNSKQTSTVTSASIGGDGNAGDSSKPATYQKKTFKVYWQRWIMLMYMSILNLLSDWTCYSVAPIATLTKDAFGDIDPEQLVVIFLGANAIASACEPMMLARLGLRRTVVVGALLLMVGSIIKSGGVPPLFQFEMIMGQEEWRIYLGFFLVGLSQPLYQCTPALLSASWFPEKERTMATGVALNANQLGIGFAFIFGTILVGDSNDIFGYFGLLSLVSTVAFMGTLIQFDDAPPTPPSDTARVMRGTIQVPTMDNLVQSFRGHVRSLSGRVQDFQDQGGAVSAPSPAMEGSTRHAIAEIQNLHAEASRHGVIPPSPMMPGRIGGEPGDENEEAQGGGNHQDQEMPYNPYMGYPQGPQGGAPPYGQFPHPQYQYPYYDPRYQQQQAYYQQQYYPYQQAGAVPGQTMPPTQPYYYPMPYPPQPHPFDIPPENLDEGAEPILTFTDHHLDIDIRDDQVIRSLRACLSRQGFIHALVAFTVSGIVINTLSTFMDYLVRLNGAPRAYTGIVGGTFQFVIMISSLIIGKQTDKTRAYYSVTIAMLVLGAFGLAECGVSLDADRGTDLRWTLVVVAALVGPLQPVSTELGVDVVYPLSENTVLVIQQLFSNLLSALFIPFFKALKDIGTTGISDTEMYERPQYTFSFYLLIVIHAAATVFFATFNGRYLRYEHELQKKAEEERLQRESESGQGSHAFHPFYDNSKGGEPDERQPLIG